MVRSARSAATSAWKLAWLAGSAHTVGWFLWVFTPTANTLPPSVSTTPWRCRWVLVRATAIARSKCRSTLKELDRRGGALGDLPYLRPSTTPLAENDASYATDEFVAPLA